MSNFLIGNAGYIYKAQIASRKGLLSRVMFLCLVLAGISLPASEVHALYIQIGDAKNLPNVPNDPIKIVDNGNTDNNNGIGVIDFEAAYYGLYKVKGTLTEGVSMNSAFLELSSFVLEVITDGPITARIFFGSSDFGPILENEQFLNRLALSGSYDHSVQGNKISDQSQVAFFGSVAGFSSTSIIVPGPDDGKTPTPFTPSDAIRTWTRDAGVSNLGGSITITTGNRGAQVKLVSARNTIPEPSSIALLGIGLAGLLGSARLGISKLNMGNQDSQSA